MDPVCGVIILIPTNRTGQKKTPPRIVSVFLPFFLQTQKNGAKKMEFLEFYGGRDFAFNYLGVGGSVAFAPQISNGFQ